MKKVEFTVYGVPRGKQRPRVVKINGFSRAFTPKETVQFENLVKIEYGIQTDNFMFDDDAQLEMRIIAYFPIPKSVSKKVREKMLSGEIRHTKKSDADNVAKIFADALLNVAYHDDNHICTLHVEKWYSDQPRTEVTISEVCE